MALLQVKTRFSLVSAILSAALLLCGCASSGSAASQDALDVGASRLAQVSSSSGSSAGKSSFGGEGSSASRGGTALAVPSSEQLRRTQLDAAAVSFLERGTPDGIRAAVERIMADSAGMSDLNRSALALAAELMSALYPLENVSWTVPSVPEQDAYSRIIRAAKMGVADYSGGDGFFSLTLPALALFYAPEASLPLAEMDAALERAFALNPASVLPPWFRAEIAQRQGRLDDAAALYKQAWELDNGCYPAGFGYARSLIRAGDARLALEIARAALGRYPSSLEAMRLCAEAHIELGNWQEAEPYITRALQADPSNTAFLLLRARILVERKEYLSANTLLDAFGTVNRTDRNYLLLKARIAREWNRNSAQAAPFLQDALRLYPDDEAVLLASAEICYESGMSLAGMTGRDLVTRVLEKSPNREGALALLVSDYIDSFEWRDAVSTAERFAAASPGDTSSLLLARAYSGSGQTGRALSIMQSLYAANPSDEEIADLYLETLVDSGDFSQARRIIDSMMAQASPSMQSKLYYHLSRLQTDPDQELSALRSSLLTDPRNSNALFAMYAWYFRTGEYRRAQYYLKQVAAINPQNREYARLLSELDALLAQ